MQRARSKALFGKLYIALLSIFVVTQLKQIGTVPEVGIEREREDKRVLQCMCACACVFVCEPMHPHNVSVYRDSLCDESFDRIVCANALTNRSTSLTTNLCARTQLKFSVE